MEILSSYANARKPKNYGREAPESLPYTVLEVSNLIQLVVHAINEKYAELAFKQ